ncbi:ankyrin repeat-containing domain protein [Biscogniauxia sp. FL1348]|nr:ankyrin repeat-containing domain protein [Biscogniauxia sp. FL1348]
MLNKHEELDRLLSEKPELVHMAAPTGDTLLHIACEYAATDAASSLIRRGARLDTRGAKGLTPLVAGVMAESLECTQLLLDNGADAKVPDILGASPLHHAVKSQSPVGNDMIKSLLAAGALFGTTYIMKETVLNWITHRKTGVCGLDRLRERLKLILDAGGVGLLEARNRWGQSPLFRASVEQNYNVLRVLLEAGAQANTECDSGVNILHLTAERGTVKVIEVLKETRITDLDIRTTDLTEDAGTPLSWLRWRLRQEPDNENVLWKRPGDQEIKAFEELLRDVRDRAILTEIAKLEGIVSKIETGKLALAKEELVQLAEAKWKARIGWEAETFRAVELDVRAGRVDVAIESLREFMGESRKRLEVSPFDEEKEPWAMTNEVEYSDGEEEEDDDDDSEEGEEGDNDNHDNTDSNDEDSR